MRAAIVERYGPPEVVEVVERPMPEPKAGEVRVRVRATTVNSGDARIRAARFPRGFALPARLAIGVRRPRRQVLGGSFSGEVDCVGAGVTDFAPGDEVCGMAGTKMGAHAEYVAVAAKKLARKPAAVSHDDAAGVLFGGSTAWHFLHDRVHVSEGQSVLVIGASGAVGTNAVQLAALAGATVTAVTSAANAALVTRLGATHVVDYATRDVTALGERFDVVFDAVGTLSIASGRRLLRPGGKLVLAVAGLGEVVRARGNVLAGPASERAENFVRLLELVAAGRLHVVHDEQFDLDHIVDAYRRVDSGHKVGNIVVHP